MPPTPPPDQELDFSHYMDHKADETSLETNMPVRKKFPISKRAMILIGILILLIAVQLVIIYAVRPPSPQPEQTTTPKTQQQTKQPSTNLKK